MNCGPALPVKQPCDGNDVKYWSSKRPRGVEGSFFVTNNSPTCTMTLTVNCVAAANNDSIDVAPGQGKGLDAADAKEMLIKCTHPAGGGGGGNKPGTPGDDPTAQRRPVERQRPREARKEGGVVHTCQGTWQLCT